MVFVVHRTEPLVGEHGCDVHQIGRRLGEIGDDLGGTTTDNNGKIVMERL